MSDQQLVWFDIMSDQENVIIILTEQTMLTYYRQGGMLYSDHDSVNQNDAFQYDT